jgi:hypothetical protein
MMTMAMTVQNHAGAPPLALSPLPVDIPARRFSQQATQVQAGGWPP